MGKVVLAVDESEHAERAWEFYNKHAKQAGDEVILVHCLDPPFQAYPLRSDVLKERVQEIMSDGERLLKKFKDIMNKNNITCQSFMDFGRPGEFVVKAANENEATMVVMGTRGMGKVRRTILGSVSDYVVHHAHCPVLVARH